MSLKTLTTEEKKIILFEKKVPCTSVVACCEIEVGTCSSPGVGGISLRRLLEKQTSKIIIEADVINGVLCVSEKRSSWGYLLSVAKDCHEQNVELSRGHQGLFLRVTRLIKAGEELFAWFAGDLITELEIPFLIPSNIKGNQAYTCHRCGWISENPNPLKVHLSLECDSTDRISSMPSTTTGNGCSSISHSQMFNNILPFITPYPTDLQIAKTLSSPSAPIRTSFAMKAPLCVLSSNEHETQTNDFLKGVVASFPVNHTAELLSKGLLRHNLSNNDRQGGPRIQLVRPMAIRSVLPPPSVMNNSPYRASLNGRQSSVCKSLPEVPSWSPDDIQTSPPVTGTSQRLSEVPRVKGHTCVYCGKIYSRKYGLKIHVRTHTGYKPLKCRFCFRPFSDPSNLNKHVRLHAESDTPYRCTYCRKVLVRRRDLERHIKSRHPDQISQGNVTK